MKLYDISEWCKHGLDLKDYPYLGEVDTDSKTYEFGTPIKVNGAYYVVSVFEKDNNSVGVRKVKIDLKGEECCYENNIVCPYCGYADPDSWECTDSDDEHECGSCGGTFSYERVVTIEYNSYPKEPPEVISGNWIKAKEELTK